MLKQIKFCTVAMILAVWSWQAAWAEVQIEQRVIPGKTFHVSDGTTYDVGERFRVGPRHQIPEEDGHVGNVPHVSHLASTHQERPQ